MEAAFLLPILFVMILMLCQPAILLYDHVVMETAAGEGCRLLMTRPTDASSAGADAYEDYVRRRLGAIPPVSIFHIHDEGCTYEIEMEGDEMSERVSVRIENQVKLLPLIGQAAALIGASDTSGTYTISVSVTMPGRPSWVTGTVDKWVEIWD